jgi:predicted dehydrogenase
MGALHAAKIRSLGATGEPVALAGVTDVDGERARALGERMAVPATGDFRELLPRAEAAVVAVPTVRHYAVVMEALKAGLDVLVEKPIAASLAEAEALLATAESQGRLLQVGHLERFNTALRHAAELIREPRFIEAHRLGPFPSRSTDVDVVRDVMIHDLDIILDLVGAEPERIEAVGVPVVSPELDIANARLTFPDGCVANVTASRVSPTPLRKIRVFQADGYLSIDLLEHRAVLFRRGEPDASDPHGIHMEPLDLDADDALAEELRSFVRAVATRGAPAVPAESAMRALRTALRVTGAMPRAGFPSGSVA